MKNGNRNLNWKIFVKLLNRCNTHDIVNMPATEDKATQRCDLSASWPLMGHAIRYRSFASQSQMIPVEEPLKSKAINRGSGRSPA